MLVILLALAMLWTLRDSPSGRWLRRWLVERPAAGLSRVSAAHLCVVLASLAAIVVAVHVLEGDGEALRLVGLSLAEAATWFIAFDVATWIEAYAVLWLLGATRPARIVVARVRALLTRTGEVIRRIGQGAREGGQRRRKPPAGRRDDDPEPFGWAGAAA